VIRVLGLIRVLTVRAVLMLFHTPDGTP